MSIAGKKALAKVGTSSSGSFNTVQDLSEASISIEGDNQDITSFGAEFIKRLQGLKDNSFELSGYYNPDDNKGQKTIQEALINDTQIFAQFLPDGSKGFQQEVKVASFEVSAAVDGVVELSVELEGTGKITLV